MTPRFIIEQKITAFANKYSVFAANPDGSKGQLLAFVQQKRLAFKERVDFYSDASKSQPIFSLRAEKVMDVHGRYLVEDTDGKLVGSFRKKFGSSLFNSTWNILDDSGEPAIVVRENSMLLAIFRRFIGLVPIIGAVGEIVALLLRYHFVFKRSDNGEAIGKYQKTTLIRDHYQLSMTDEAYESQDWRVLAAMAVALDALQSR